MRVLIATEPGSPDRENEDWATATPDLVVVLDGATARTATGCVHGVAWYTNKLGAAIIAQAAEHRKDLPDALATAISDVAALHAECDLSHPGTPSAAVGILRKRHDALDVLVLADITIAMRRHDGSVQCVTDDRVDHIAIPERKLALSLDADDPRRDAALRSMKRAQMAVRNRPGGYFVAAAEPSVAREAHTGIMQCEEFTHAALMSDGAASAVKPLNLLTWEDLFPILQVNGPGELLRMVRAAEATDRLMRRWPRTKACDDATAAYVQL